jgi:tetratricopeptide (TPR) repeat protein
MTASWTARLPILLLATLAILPSSGAEPQTMSAPTPLRTAAELEPWRDGLDPVPLPSLEHLDPAVARQLELIYRDIRETLGDAGASATRAMEAYGLLGRVFHAYELLDVAAASYLNASRLAPGEYRWLHSLADVARRRGDLEAARRYHEAALDLRPRDVPSLVGKAEACAGLNALDVAEESFRAALALDPGAAAAHAGLGQLALQQRRFAEAVTRFEKALEIVPEANRLHYGLAMALRGLGRADEARRHLSLSGPVGVRTADPVLDRLQELLRGERVHLVRGRLAYANGRYAEAAIEFGAAVEADPRSVRAHVNLGATLVALGDTQGAIGRLREAVALAPENGTARYNLGTLLAAQGAHAEAVEQLRAVVSLDRGDGQAHLILARSLAATGESAEALRHLSRAMELDPRDEEPVLEAARLLVGLGRHAEALAVAEAAHDRAPEHGRTAHVLAYLLVASPDPALRDGERALELARRVHAAVPSADHARTLAAALAELDRCAEAAREVDRALAGLGGDAGAADVRPALEADLRRYRSGPPCRLPAGP